MGQYVGFGGACSYENSTHYNLYRVIEFDGTRRLAGLARYLAVTPRGVSSSMQNLNFEL